MSRGTSIAPRDGSDTAGRGRRTLGSTATSLASYQLAGGSAYLVQATPSIEVSGTGIGGNHVTVTCTLAAGPAVTATVTRSVTVHVDANGDTEYASLPLSVTAPSSTSAISATLGCTQSVASGGTGTPTVAAQATIYALGINPTTTTTTTGRNFVGIAHGVGSMA